MGVWCSIDRGSLRALPATQPLPRAHLLECDDSSRLLAPSNSPLYIETHKFDDICDSNRDFIVRGKAIVLVCSPHRPRLAIFDADTSDSACTNKIFSSKLCLTLFVVKETLLFMIYLL